MFVRKFVGKVLTPFLKDQIKRALGLPPTRLHPHWEVLRPIGPMNDSHIVIDVGAHHGWFFHCWLDWCPKAVVHAFEPTEESFLQMQKLYGDDPRVHLAQVGIGSVSGDMQLNVLADSQVSNSFLAPRQSAWDAIEYGTGMITQRKVPVTILDAYCAEQAIEQAFLLKIDVQGYEIEVLKGASETLKRTDYVFVEAGIQRLYECAPSFAEVCQFMEMHEFHLMHMRTWHRGNRVLVETDMIFRRNGLAPPIDRDHDRYYLELR